jgi:hypothetical protein
MLGRFLFAAIFITLCLSVASQGFVPGRVFWRGMVDDRIQLVIHGDTIETRTVSGRVMPDGVYSFTSPITGAASAINVTKVRGRGTVKVVQQPLPDNDQTAIVEIFDDKGGAKEYQLEISWN